MLERYSISLMVHWWNLLGAYREHTKKREAASRKEDTGRAYQTVPRIIKEMSIEELKRAYRESGFDYLGFLNGAERGLGVLVQRGTELFLIETSTRTNQEIAAMEALNFVVNNAVILGNESALEKFRYEM